MKKNIVRNSVDFLPKNSNKVKMYHYETEIKINNHFYPTQLFKKERMIN